MSIADTLIEWYLLSLVDDLVVNRLNVEDSLKGHAEAMWNGRISSMPKTAWAFSLRDTVVDAGTCRFMRIPLEGCAPPLSPVV